jgi:gas vesicle protein
MRAKDRVSDATENIKPYVERAMADEKLREDVMRAFGSAREIYQDLMGEKNAITLASRVATDDDIRDKVRDAIEDLRHASERLQGKRDHSGRNATLLVAGIALGMLFNPLTGPETRRFIRDMLSSGGGDADRKGGGSNGRESN